MSIKKVLPVLIVTCIVAWISLATACKKNSIADITPSNPNVPTDTIPPVNPNDTITPDTLLPAPGKVANFYYRGGNDFPPLDSIRRYANDPEYDSVYIKWCPTTQAYWTPNSFHTARDSLRKRFNISPKVRGGWWVRPRQILPDCDSTNIGVMGMIRQDSTWYADRNYIILPVICKNGEKTQPAHYNGNRVLKANRLH